MPYWSAWMQVRPIAYTVIILQSIHHIAKLEAMRIRYTVGLQLDLKISPARLGLHGFSNTLYRPFERHRKSFWPLLAVVWLIPETHKERGPR